MRGLDFIGDVHGEYDKLTGLLKVLGYSRDGGWHHPDGRRAVFAGDIIDRGAKQLECVETVRAMTADGAALCVMGNHEYNALSYAAGVRKLNAKDAHWSFLNRAGDGSPVHKEILRWMETLPLWLDLGEVRVVHACWDPEAVAWLQSRYPEGRGLTRERLAFLGAWKKKVPEAKKEDEALDMILKGPEVKLPAGIKFKDAQGQARSEIRLRWWDEKATTYRKAAMIAQPEIVPEEPLPPGVRFCVPDKPTVIGHYWMAPKDYPKILSEQVVCVDFSAARGGPLAAYRWDGGDTGFSADKFVCFPEKSAG